MTIKVTTTVQREVEREISLPYFFKAWPLDSYYKVIDENTVICVDTMPSWCCVRVSGLNSTITGYMEHERSEEVTEQEFNAALLTAQQNIGAITGQPFVEALKHLKEMTYTACTIEGKAYGARIDAALSFLEDHEALLKQPAPEVEPVTDNLPF